MSEGAISAATALLQSLLPQSDFCLLTAECDGALLFLYSRPPSASFSNDDEKEEKKASLFGQIDLRCQRNPSPLLPANSGHHLLSTQQSASKPFAFGTVPGAIAEDRVLPKSDLLVFPRESVLSGLVRE